MLLKSGCQLPPVCAKQTAARQVVQNNSPYVRHARQLHISRLQAADNDPVHPGTANDAESSTTPQQHHHTPTKQQQPQQQSDLPPGYDPNAAAGFMPQPGDKPMWWVEKFEARRKHLAMQQASSSTSAEPDAAAAANGSAKAWLPKAAQQLLQLAIVNALLILWPASLYPGGLAAAQVWLLFWAYMLFFAGGSVYRLVKFGPLAPRKTDVQGKKWWSTAAWLFFVISIPVIHWPPVGAFLKRQQQLVAAGNISSVATLYDALGFGFLAAAVGLNWWAARHLGRAYDRVIAPEMLVTDGPYAIVQHPIYTSYMLLFVGYGLTLHSWPNALLALVVCLVYYMSRTELEKGVLQQTFGQQYAEYSRKTKLFVPFLL